MNLVEAFYSQVIPVGLWVVMLGMGLALTMGDIRNIFAMPKAILVGLFGQMVLLPILGFILAVLFAPTPEIAVGVLILASCPGGVTSNAYSFATRADVALSVSLTAGTAPTTSCVKGTVIREGDVCDAPVKGPRGVPTGAGLGWEALFVRRLMSSVHVQTY